MKLGSELCALFRGTVFPPVETAGAEALWLERLVVSRQQEIEGVQERRGKERERHSRHPAALSWNHEHSDCSPRDRVEQTIG